MKSQEDSVQSLASVYAHEVQCISKASLESPSKGHFFVLSPIKEGSIRMTHHVSLLPSESPPGSCTDTMEPSEPSVNGQDGHGSPSFSFRLQGDRHLPPHPCRCAHPQTRAVIGQLPPSILRRATRMKSSWYIGLGSPTL